MERKPKRNDIMKIDNKFNKRQKELLKKHNIDIFKDYNEISLEELEDFICEIMTNSLDKNQDFTALAIEYEDILNIIVEIENNL